MSNEPEMAAGQMKQFFAELFIWWHRQTLSMRLSTRFRGRYVGMDEFGNRYYQHKKKDRRWVIYNGPAEASAIPPGWHGWMHRRTDVPPSADNYQPRGWQLPHKPNLTGTAGAYHPPGSLLSGGQRPRVSSDYDAWSPDS